MYGGRALCFCWKPSRGNASAPAIGFPGEALGVFVTREIHGWEADYAAWLIEGKDVGHFEHHMQRNFLFHDVQGTYAQRLQACKPASPVHSAFLKLRLKSMVGPCVFLTIKGWFGDLKCFGSAQSESDSYTLLGTLSWLLLDAIVWGLLWLYLDQVPWH